MWAHFPQTHIVRTSCIIFLPFLIMTAHYSCIIQAVLVEMEMLKNITKKKKNKFNGGRVPATRLQQSHNHPSIVVMVQNWKSLRALRLAARITTTNQRPQRTVSKTSHTHPDKAYRHAAVLHAAPLGSTPISQPGNDIAAAQCRQITSPLPAYARSEWPDVLAPKIYVPTCRSEKHLS